jgi:hypothetical protein
MAACPAAEEEAEADARGKGQPMLEEMEEQPSGRCRQDSGGGLTEAVGEAVLDGVEVEEEVLDGVEVEEAVLVGDGVSVALLEGEAVRLLVTDGVPVLVPEAVGEALVQL